MRLGGPALRPARVSGQHFRFGYQGARTRVCVPLAPCVGSEAYAQTCRPLPLRCAPARKSFSTKPNRPSIVIIQVREQPTGKVAGRVRFSPSRRPLQASFAPRKLQRSFSLGRRPYGVRSAVTSRACRIPALEPAARRQDASKFGQACCEQSFPTGRISSRSALARACGTLASTVGAKPGRTVRAAAKDAAIATAERVLIMTVPCYWALVARFVVIGPSRPVSLASRYPSARFRMSSPGLGNGFVPPEFCFVVRVAKKHGPLAEETP
jgi:hypothetical protein